MLNKNDLRVVYLTDTPMFLQGGGHELRVASIGRALAKHFDVTNLAICGTDWTSEKGTKEPECGQLEFVTEQPVAWGQQKPKSHLWGTRFDSQIAQSLMRRLEEIDPAWVYVGGIRLAAHALEVAQMGHRLIVDMHNDEVDLANQVLSTIPRRNWLRRKKFSAKLDRLRCYQNALLANAATISCCSTKDVARFERAGIPPNRLVVVPNEIPHACEFSWSRSKSDPTAIFVGTLNYAPNVEGLRWFNTKIAPMILRQYPKFRLLVVGRSPTRATVRELARYPFTELHVDLRDISQLYRQATLSVVPLLAGGGTRIKILEAAAYGLPTISTSIGAEGLEVLRSQCYWSADSALEFQSRMCKLFDAPPNPQGISQFVNERFGSVAIGNAVVHCVEAAMTTMLAHGTQSKAAHSASGKADLRIDRN